jgi:hypothetical protein
METRLPIVSNCIAASDCKRPVHSLKLCETHYAEQVRGREFTRDGNVQESKVLSVRLSAETLAELGPRPSLRARAVLEAWAKAQRTGG